MIGTVICAAEGCDNPVVRPRQPGRPAIYCSPDCRPSRVAGPGRPDVAVEVEQDVGHDGDGPHRGRDWLVRLQRGTDSVTVARDLGRFSALTLAGELRHLFAHARQRGDAIE